MGSEDTGTDRIGQIVADRYELQRVLGVGGAGTVYEALHRYTNRSVALKVMHPHLSGARDAVSRFLREARAAAAVGHPGIPQVLDAGPMEDGRPYIVHELLEGRTLESAIESGELTEADVTRIGLRLLDVLAAAHERGIVHRDVKPDNVFLVRGADDALDVRLLDFGVAKNLQSVETSGVLTKPGTTVGTPHYMSPEQARAHQVDARTDVWAVGAVLFHARAGRPPFDEQSLPLLLMRLVTQRPPHLREVVPDAAPHLARAVDGALEPDREKRWPSAKAMSDALSSPSSPDR